MTTEAEPYIARRPRLTIGTTELQCHMRKVTLTPADAEVDVATFCKPGARAPGTTVWTMEIDVLQSFGDGVAVTGTVGLHDALAPMAKTVQEYELQVDNLAGPDSEHPYFTGTVWVPSIPVIDSQIGDKSEFTLTFAVNEDPTKVVSGS